MDVSTPVHPAVTPLINACSVADVGCSFQLMASYQFIGLKLNFSIKQNCIIDDDSGKYFFVADHDSEAFVNRSIYQ